MSLVRIEEPNVGGQLNGFLKSLTTPTLNVLGKYTTGDETASSFARSRVDISGATTTTTTVIDYVVGSNSSGFLRSWTDERYVYPPEGGYANVWNIGLSSNGSIPVGTVDFYNVPQVQGQPLNQNGFEVSITQVVGNPHIPGSGSLSLGQNVSLQANAVYFVSLTCAATNAAPLSATDQLTITIQPSAVNVGNQSVNGNVGGDPWAGSSGLNATFSGVVKTTNTQQLAISYQFYGANAATYTFLNTNNLFIQRVG